MNSPTSGSVLQARRIAYKSARHSRSVRAWFVIICAIALPAWPQAEQPATIISEGEGTVNVPPAVVALELTVTQQGDTFAAAMQPLVDFEDQLRAAFQDAELKPLEVTVSGVRLTQLESTKTATITATIRFDMAPITTAESPAEEFAARIDQIHAVATAVAGGELSDPTFEAADPQTLEQDAVSRATENALYRADAVATLMESRIYAVQRVHIQEVQWLTGDAAALPAEMPSLDNITCRARVEVEYLYAPY